MIFSLSVDSEDHESLMGQVFSRLQLYDLVIKLRTFTLEEMELESLVQFINSQGLRPLGTKVHAIRRLP